MNIDRTEDSEGGRGAAASERGIKPAAQAAIKPAAETHPSRLGMIALALGACVAGAWAVSRIDRSPGAGFAHRPVVRVAPPLWRVDLSTASVDELALLPEIGPALAARIVADRGQRGPFASVDDLGRVEGIGERTIAQLRAVARVSTP